MNWYQKPSEEILSEFDVSFEKGLIEKFVKEKLHQFGYNVLAKEKRETILDLFIRQFKSPLIYILFAAAALVFFLGDILDGTVILAVIAINSIVGTIQEGRARNSLEKLRALTRHKALVRREGEEVQISAEEIVPGDILIINSGDRISADARIIKLESLKVDESILTGEAYSVEKSSQVISRSNLVVGDQKNMVFAGTNAVAGYCEAVVVATGLDGELGKISQEIKETSSVPLPLQKKIEGLTRFIGISVFAIASLVFMIGILRGIPFLEIFTATVGIVVSLIPEGLPVAVTIVLANGVWRMAKAKAIVRQMAAVEAMGNADCLLVDKTGTITTGKMVIRKVLFRKTEYTVSGNGYDPKGEIKSEKYDKLSKSSLREVMGLVYLSLKADTVNDDNGGWKPSGDPTEVAISVLCRKLDLVKENLEERYKTILANPFDQQKRFIEAVFEKEGRKYHVFVGAPDFLSKSLKVDHGFGANYHEMAKEGLRVVGVAIFGANKKKIIDWALLAIDEEIRPAVHESIKEAKLAGFRVVMLTGDYPETAKAIATKVGIFEEGNLILTGADLEQLTQNELTEKIKNVSVFSRITPEHKLKIVKAFQKIGKICAMTGDGVNDAPALQAANLGIALGSGTQVAKDSSDIVLVNNNFETITEAISQGRAIYFSLKKVILYLLATSLGEVAVLALAIIVGLPLPLLAVQIIWLNFVTDGFFVVALARDGQDEKGLISTGALDTQNLVDKLMVQRSILMGAAMVVCAGPVFYYLQKTYPLDYARSVTLLILAISQWFNAFNVRSRTKSIFVLTPGVWLVGALGTVFVLQIVAFETDIGNKFLHTRDIELRHWILAFGVSTLVIWAEELRKIFARRKSQGIVTYIPV